MATDRHTITRDGSHDELRPISAELKRLFRRGWWLILACTTCGLMIGLVRLSSTAEEYMAGARIYVVGNEAPEAPGSAARLAVHRFNAQLGSPGALIQSKELVREAIKIGNLGEFSTLQRARDPVDYILTHLRVVDSDGSGPKTQSMMLTAEDPVEAEQILISLIEATIAYYAEWKDKSNQAVVDALEERRSRLAREYSDKLDKRREYQLAHGDAALGDRDLEMRLQQLSDTAGTVNRLALRRLEADMKVAWLRAAPQTESNRPLGLPTLEVAGGAAGQVGGVSAEPDRRKFKALAQEYGPLHPEYLEAQSRIKDSSRIELHAVQAEALRLADQEKALRDTLAARREEVMAANKDVVALRLIENDIAGIEKLIHAVDKHLRSIRLLDESATAEVIVLESPRGRDVPLSSDSTRIVMMPVVVGLLIGLAMAYWVLPDDRRQLVSPTETIEKSIGVPVLGVVHAASPDTLLVPGTGHRSNRIRRPVDAIR